MNVHREKIIIDVNCVRIWLISFAPLTAPALAAVCHGRNRDKCTEKL